MRVIEKLLCSFLALLTFTMSGPWQASAQQGTSTIVGSVVNNQKSPVPGIKILAKDPSGKILGEAVTNAEGFYNLENLGIGQYQLTLDPLKSLYLGETVVTSLGPQGLTVDWIVSESAKAIASATLGIASAGHVALGDMLAMAATPGPAPAEPGALSETSKAILAGVIASGWLGSLIWAATTTTTNSFSQ